MNRPKSLRREEIPKCTSCKNCYYLKGERDSFLTTDPGYCEKYNFRFRDHGGPGKYWITAESWALVCDDWKPRS